MLSIVLTISGFSLLAQAPPNPPGDAGGSGGPVGGGGAPIGSGIVLLITLAAGYGGKKVFDARKKLAEQTFLPGYEIRLYSELLPGQWAALQMPPSRGPAQHLTASIKAYHFHPFLTSTFLSFLVISLSALNCIFTFFTLRKFTSSSFS